MARLVRHEATGPIEVKPQEKSVWICACGLSKSQPFCDGSHKICRQKETEQGKLYIYDKQGMDVEEVRDE